MRRKIVVLLLIFILFIAQTAIFPRIDYLAVVPDLMMILTVSIGFMQGRTEGLITGFICGMLVDLFYGDIFGFNALLYMIPGYLSGRFSRIYFDEDVKMPLILVTGSCLLKGMITYITRFLLRGRVQFPAYFLRIILPEIVCTLIFTIILYRIFYGINHSLVKKEKEGNRSLWIRD